MKITIEVEFDADYDIDSGLQGLYFDGCTQNVEIFLSPEELVQAQCAAESEYERQLIAKVDAIRERQEIIGDCRRETARDIALEYQREALAEGMNQRRIGA